MQVYTYIGTVSHTRNTNLLFSSSFFFLSFFFFILFFNYIVSGNVEICHNFRVLWGRWGANDFVFLFGVSFLPLLCFFTLFTVVNFHLIPPSSLCRLLIKNDVRAMLGCLRNRCRHPRKVRTSIYCAPVLWQNHKILVYVGLLIRKILAYWGWKL